MAVVDVIELLERVLQKLKFPAKSIYIGVPCTADDQWLAIMSKKLGCSAHILKN